MAAVVDRGLREAAVFFSILALLLTLPMLGRVGHHRGGVGAQLRSVVAARAPWLQERGGGVGEMPAAADSEHHGRAAAASDAERNPPARRVSRLSLPEFIKQNLFGMGVTKLFDIQARAFDPILRGRSFVGRSRTGTGKTIAYLLPVLERARSEKMTAPHSVLILVPTRELCKQVGGTILTLSVTTDVALVHGGQSLGSQEQVVRLGASVVVATPGRCARLLGRGAIDPQNVRVLVVDEADAMLGQEYIGRVEKVLVAVDKEGLQSVLFSASLPPEVLGFIRKYFKEHDFADLVDRAGVRTAATVQAVTHNLCRVPKARNARTQVLLHLLATNLDELGGRCIIFVDSTTEAKALLAHPVLDRKARALHSDSTSQDRDVVLTAFANQDFEVLIATDLVSRGVDFRNVTLVLMSHPPKDPAIYLHRAGRTGRAGHGGVCITLYDTSEGPLVQRVRQTTRQKFRQLAAPAPEDVHHAAVSRLLEELLSVQTEQFGPMMDDARRLLEELGPNVLATAMAVLNGRHADFARSIHESPSVMSGRSGYVCLLAHDPDHTTIPSEGDVRRVFCSLLQDRANDDAVGRIARTSLGWAADVEHRWALPLLDDLRTARRTAPFEITMARRMPRLSRAGMTSARARRLPWTSWRRRAFANRRKTAAVPSVRRRRGTPRSDGRWPGRRRGS